MDKRNPERVKWLKNNPVMWEGKRLDERTIKAIHGMMQVAGLYAFSTVYYHSQDNVRKMIRKLRANDR